MGTAKASDLMMRAVLVTVALLLCMAEGRRPPVPKQTNVTKPFSPLTGNPQWPLLDRLMAVVVCTCFGSLLAGFFITSFFVESSLRRVGNIFLACLGTANGMVPSLVLPVIVYNMLAGDVYSGPVCRWLYFIVLTSCYSASIFYAFVGLECYYRVCRSSNVYVKFISMRIGLVSIMVFVVSLALAAVGVYGSLDYDYCERKFSGSFYFRVMTTSVFYVLPLTISFVSLIATKLDLRKKGCSHGYKRSMKIRLDQSIVGLNITSLLYFMISWMPYVIIVYFFPDVSDAAYYKAVYFGLSRTLVMDCLYMALNRNFRRAFSYTFNYLFCKITLPSSAEGRQRRRCKFALKNVNVHVLHLFVSDYQQRAAIRETNDL